MVLFAGEDNVILHVFPNPDKESERFNIWRNAVGGEILSLDHGTVFKLRRVCHLHFESTYHTWGKRLSPNAIPTLNLRGKNQKLVNISVLHYR